jgi:hypothetical protein
VVVAAQSAGCRGVGRIVFPFPGDCKNVGRTPLVRSRPPGRLVRECNFETRARRGRCRQEFPRHAL